MKTLFKSDMGRIFKNPLFYIVSVLSLVLLFFVRNSVPDLEYQSKSFTTCFLLVGNFVIPILYYYLVFGDDLKYGVFAFDIGRGISRRELIISKAIEFAVLLSLFYGLSLGVIVLRLVYVGIPVTMGVLSTMLYKLILTELFQIIGDMFFAGIFLYQSQNFVIGVLSFIGFRVIGLVYMVSLQDKLHLPINEVSYDGLVNDGFVALSTGNFPWKLILALMIYIGGAIIISSILFEKKELDL